MVIGIKLGRIFNTTDYVTFFLALIPLLTLPFLIGYRKRSLGLLDLTFAGRGLRYITMAINMFLSQNGFSELAGFSGWAVQYGLGIYAHKLVFVIGLVILGWIFMPVYMASGSLTTIDYAKKRFGGKRIEIVLVILMLIINLVTKVSVELHSAHEMMGYLFDVPFGTVYAGILLGSVILVSTGGLFTLVYTNLWSIIFFALGIPVVFIFSYQTFFSWEEITVKYKKSWSQTTIEHVANGSDYAYAKCGIPDVYALTLVRPHNDPVLPWPGMIFGQFIISVYTFCIDQSILQFCLCGKNIVNVKYACIVDGFLQILTIFMIIPGFLARVLFTDIVACADPDVCYKTCGKRSGCGDLALPLLFQKVVPKGWRGIVVAASLACSLTSVAATLHAGSTVFTFNVYRTLRPRAREAELTVTGKLVIVIQGLIGLVLVALIQRLTLIHDIMLGIYASLVPPIVAVYFISIFWEHVTEQIAFYTLVVGSCLAFTNLIWRSIYESIPCGEEYKIHVPEILANFHDLHFAIFLFVVCCSFIIIKGMTTKPIDHVHLYRLIFWLRHSNLDRVDINDMKYYSQSFEEAEVVSATLDEESSSQKYSDAVDDYGEYHAYDLTESETHENNRDTNAIEKKGFLSKFAALSNREITDDLLREAMKEKMSVRELSRQTHTLNMILVFLLLVITYFMAFFS